MALVASGSHVTLHYRLAVLEEDIEREVFSTLGGHPATLQIGAGQLASGVEQRLIGLAEGAQVSFDLAPDEAFGPRNPGLIRSLSRAGFERNAEAGAEYAAGDVLAINVPDSGQLAGVLIERNDERVVIDFNHPLAGRRVRFAARIIGVL